MLDLIRSEPQNTGKMTRRQMLRAGFLGLGGLTLADLLRLRATAGASQPKKDTAVIFLWVHGGPSHLETYDLKPDAPTDTRSLFKPIHTKVPGMDICELLPKHAAIADKFTLLRSVAHDEADHGFGTRRFCTGYASDLPNSNNGPSLYPSLECGVNRALGVLRDGLPVSVNVGGFAGSPWRGPGFWGQNYAVPNVYVHPDSNRTDGLKDAALRVPAVRFGERRQLLGDFDRFRADLDTHGTMDAMDGFRKQAYEILSSGKVRDAFDITKEEPKVRDRYGLGSAQDVLLARRLVEAGVNFVNVYVPGKPPHSKGTSFNWDDHAVNWDLPTAMQDRLPWYDHMVSTLIEDIYERGLNEKVMVIVSGEFGRTPRIERNANGKIGRDHWPSAMSILVSGGGRSRGNIIGSTNSKGEEPKTRRYDPRDFLATVYRFLGIDHAMEFPDIVGRPLPLTYGSPIEELL